MLKKLRIKFIALNMATVAVVLTVVFAAICVVNHRQSVATVDGALNQAIAQASEHQGRQMGKDALGEGQPESGNGQAAPDDGEAGGSQASDGRESPAQAAEQAGAGLDASSGVAAPPTIGGRERSGGAGHPRGAVLHVLGRRYDRARPLQHGVHQPRRA